MIQYYRIDHRGLQTIDKNHEPQWVQLQDPSEAEITSIIRDYQLPNDIFIAKDYPDEVSRYETIYSPYHHHLSELVLFNLHPNSNLPMEEQLQPISFIFTDKVVISCANQGCKTLDQFIINHQNHITSIELFLLHMILSIYQNFAHELEAMKKIIDRLDQNARITTKNEELFLLSDTERKLVYLDHTLSDQALALKNLWND